MGTRQGQNQRRAAARGVLVGERPVHRLGETLSYCQAQSQPL